MFDALISHHLSHTHTQTSKWVPWRNKTAASHANTLNFDTWHGRPFWREARNMHISRKGGDTAAVAGSWKDCLVTRSPRHAVNCPWLGPNCKIQFAEMRSRPASRVTPDHRQTGQENGRRFLPPSAAHPSILAKDTHLYRVLTSNHCMWCYNVSSHSHHRQTSGSFLTHTPVGVYPPEASLGQRKPKQLLALNLLTVQVQSGRRIIALKTGIVGQAYPYQAPISSR